MATRKELSEAHQFGRRRLVTAFLSGAPGGREAEPPRTARTAVGGVALAGLLVAAAAIAGSVGPRDPSGWKDVGLVVSKETGAAYVITEPSDEPLLRPVVNITSARLVLGPGHEPSLVSQDSIEQQRTGAAIGISGAPADVPASDLLVDEGWTACTGDGLGTQLHVSADPQVSYAGGGAAVVRHATTGDHYLLAEEARTGSGAPTARRYLLGAAADPLLNALGLRVTADAVEVSGAWLALLPEGGSLSADAFGLGDTDAPAPRSGGVPAGARVGDLVSTGEHGYLLTPGGPVLLDPFALAVWNATRPGVEHHIEDIPDSQAGPTHAAAHWPDTRLRDVLGEVCVQLQPREDGTPVVRLAEQPTGEASAEEVGDGSVAQAVDPGRGAHVLAGSWDGGTGSPVLVDSTGAVHALAGEDTGEMLGYGDHVPRVVPESWVALLVPGVSLSREAALREPARQRPRPAE